MAAGLGFKTFTTGEVLTAADVNGYLMQGVLVFANSTARDAAITSPQEGQFAYLKDTNVTTYYTGSAWANLDTTGMTNPMTTTGDTIYSSSGSTPARLGIGTAGQVLTVNSGATAPEWTTPGGGGANWSLINAGGTALTGAQTVTVSSISGADQLLVYFSVASSANASSFVTVRFNTDTAANYNYTGWREVAAANYQLGNTAVEDDQAATYVHMGAQNNSAGGFMSGYLFVSGCNSAGLKTYWGAAGASADTIGGRSHIIGGFYDSASTISSVSLFSSSGNWDNGTLFIYKTA